MAVAGRIIDGLSAGSCTSTWATMPERRTSSGFSMVAWTETLREDASTWGLMAVTLPLNTRSPNASIFTSMLWPLTICGRLRWGCVKLT